jgi:hypothetical protein
MPKLTITGLHSFTPACRVGVLESEMNMARCRRKGEVGGKDGLRESKRIERTFKSIGLPSLEYIQ